MHTTWAYLNQVTLFILQSISFQGFYKLPVRLKILGPSFENWIILLGSNVLIEWLNLARILSALVCPKNLEFQYCTETWFSVVFENLTTRSIWLVCVTLFRLSLKDIVKKLLQFISSTRSWQKCRTMPKLVKYGDSLEIFICKLTIWIIWCPEFF